MLGLALVQLEHPAAVVALDHAGVLVLGVGLVDHPAVLGAGLQRAHGQGDQQRDGGGGERVAAHRPQPPHRHDRDRQREDQEGAPRAHERDEQQGRQQRPHQRARRGQRVQPAGHASRLLDRGHRQPNGPGGHGPQQQDRHRHQHQHRSERAEEGPGGDLVEGVDGHVQQRVGGEGHERQQRRGHQREQAQAAHVRVAVGQPPAQPVADRQRDQHDADRVGPHDGGGAEVGGEQPHGGDLGAEGARPHHEDQQRQGRHSAADLRDLGAASRAGPAARSSPWRSRAPTRRPRPPARSA